MHAVSVDNVDDEGSFQISHEAEFTSTLYVHITLLADTEAGSPSSAQLLQYWKHAKTLSTYVAFKRVIAWNGMIRGHVNMVICVD